MKLTPTYLLIALGVGAFLMVRAAQAREQALLVQNYPTSFPPGSGVIRRQDDVYL